MKYYKRNYLFLVGILPFFTGCMSLTPTAPAPGVQSSSYETIQSMKKATDFALQQQNSVGKTLIVFDIDDTLLAAEQDLGSVAWYDWQDRMLGSNTPSNMRVKDYANLFEYVSLLYATTDMKPTEPGVPSRINDLQSNGVLVYAMTARSPKDRGATVRELEDQNLRFADIPDCRANALNPNNLCSKSGILHACQIQKVAKAKFGSMLTGDRTSGKSADKIYFSGYSENCVNGKDIKDPALFSSRGRDVSFADGVMMVEGQNKGVMLELLLDSIKSAGPFNQVIFVDDSEKNVKNLQKVSNLRGHNWKIYLYQEPAIKKERQGFATNSSRQLATHKKLKALLDTTCELKTYCPAFFKVP